MYEGNSSEAREVGREEVVMLSVRGARVPCVPRVPCVRVAKVPGRPRSVFTPRRSYSHLSTWEVEIEIKAAAGMKPGTYKVSLSGIGRVERFQESAGGEALEVEVTAAK